MAAKTEAENRERALHNLAVLGGKLTTADDITFAGTKFVIPAHLSLREGAMFLDQRADDEESEVSFTRIFKYRPHDGARAAAKAIREAFGFTMGKTLYSFFGKQPPQMIDIEIGPNGQRESVPWGAMRLPGLRETVLYLQETHDPDHGEVFQVTINGPRKYRFHFEGLFSLIEKYLKEESIYKGKAFDGQGHYIDTSVIDPTKVVYTDTVQRRLKGDLWSFIRYEHQLASYGQDGKYAVLLEGPFGCGKTLAAGLTAQVANDHDWTFLMCRPGKDDLQQALQTARLYPPAVVFAEDIDTRIAAGALDINQSLDMIDGFHTKGQKLIVVFTTNNADKIHAGMLRPGRIGAVISISGMDRPGIETLTRRVVGDGLEDDVDFDAVAEAMEGYMPAFVHEALNRSVRYSIADNEGELGRISTFNLVDAANGLRDQLALMEQAKTGVAVDTLGTAVAGIVNAEVHNIIEGTNVVDNDGDWMYTLSTNDS